MNHLKKNKYLTNAKKGFDPVSIVLGFAGIGGAFYSVISLKDINEYVELRSFFVVFGGTFGILLFQFSIKVLFQTFYLSFKSLFKSHDTELVSILNELDHAIVNKTYLSQLRDSKEINGDFINDALYMLQQGLVFEEIESFLNSRITHEYFSRDTSVDFLRKGASIAPALGLFGTVMGLIGVLKTLSDPSMIGPSMSLALMTTAYGAGLGSLIFTPLVGRIEQYNFSFLENNQQLLGKLKILVFREEKRFDSELHVEIGEKAV